MLRKAFTQGRFLEDIMIQFQNKHFAIPWHRTIDMSEITNIRPRFRLNTVTPAGHSDELETLGYYKPGKRPTIIDPISNATIGDATMIHEHVHQTLTINTTYGYLTQVLNILARRGQHIQELQFFEAEQWDVQEAAATYAELCLVARKYADHFDKAVRDLPSESAGDPAYRECFEFLNRLLPIDVKSPASLLIAQGDTIIAMAGSALNSDCLSRFSNPELLNPTSAEAYLREQSPNDRFQRIVQSAATQGTFQELLARHIREREQANTSTQWLVLEIAKIVPDMPIVTTNADFQARVEEFAKAWNPYLTSLDIHMRNERAASESLAEILENPARLRRIQEGFATEKWSLDASILREKLQEARKNRSGIMLAFAMKIKEAVFLELLPYPLGDDGHSPIAGLDSLEHFLKNGGFQGGILRTEDVISILEEFPEFPTAATFYRASLLLWTPQTFNRKCFDNAIVACVETELSKETLDDVLSINKLRTAGKYFFIQLHKDQYAACFINPQRAGLYAIVNAAGEGGMALLNALADQMGVEPFESSAVNIGPHTELLKLMALAILEEVNPAT